MATNWRSTTSFVDPSFLSNWIWGSRPFRFSTEILRRTLYLRTALIGTIFLFDNCSTRLLDQINGALVDSGFQELTYGDPDGAETFRQHLEPYLTDVFVASTRNQSWTWASCRSSGYTAARIVSTGPVDGLVGDGFNREWATSNRDRYGPCHS